MSKALLEFSHKVLKSTGLLGRAKRTALPLVNQTFFIELIEKTDNFFHTKWLGNPILQNVLDLWTIQETIAEIKPELLIETGTNQGGSALFYAHLFDLMGKGRVITVDVDKLHSIQHERIEFLIGSSVSNEIASRIKEVVASTDGPVMVILDSDHSTAHVRKELEIYAPCVTTNSYMLVQDGVTDDIPALGERHPPGPLYAIRDFLTTHKEFAIDRERCDRFIITQHTDGWLKKIA
jgi:cephalosporin hydroxylase